MKYPQFFDRVETITLVDKLAKFLGTFEDGLIEVRYVDVVKFAGHSCPTVAGAYLMSKEALKALYGDSLPTRGEIEVEFKESIEDGVAGVIANVISNITGATDKSGFKGLNGKFSRVGLMKFHSQIDSNAKFTRVDNNQSVEVFYNPQAVPSNPNMQNLMQKLMQKEASEDEAKEFGRLWQSRVEEILCNTQKYPDLIKVSVK
jgi:formylmethanofuran dehydrogenase subunit E